MEGQEIAIAEAPPEGGAKVIDLMEALRASLKQATAERSPAAEEGMRKAPKRAQQEESAPAAKKASSRRK